MARFPAPRAGPPSELFDGNNVILATPTGSGKSIVAVAAHFAALADNRVTFYT